MTDEPIDHTPRENPMNAADELAAAAHRLHAGTLTNREQLDPLLAALLQQHAAYADLYDQLWRADHGRSPREDEHPLDVRDALALARAINDAA
jgi:hypothetical protein